VRILIIADQYKFGGTYEFLIKLLRHHHELGYSTTLLIERHRKNLNLRMQCKKYGTTIYVYPNRISLFTKPYLSVLFELIVYFIFVKRIPHDLLVVSSARPWLDLTYFLFPKPLAFITHSYPNQQLSWRSCLMKILPGFANYRKQFIVVSKFAAEQSVKYLNLDKRFINVIYNSCSLEIQRINLREKRVIVLTVGLLTSVKNPNLWLEVAKRVTRQLSSVKFVWVGGDDSQISAMNTKIKKHGLDGRVKLIEYSSKISKYFQKASVYFQPSFIENHSIAVVEAMVAGLPCVVSNVGGMPESVVDNITGYLIDRNDVDGFVNAIKIIVENQSIANDMGMKGRIRAKRYFSEEVQKSKIRQLYQTLTCSRMESGRY